MKIKIAILLAVLLALGCWWHSWRNEWVAIEQSSELWLKVRSEYRIGTGELNDLPVGVYVRRKDI